MLAYGLKKTLSNEEEKMNMQFKMVFIQHHSILMKMTEYIKLHVEGGIVQNEVKGEEQGCLE